MALGEMSHSIVRKVSAAKSAEISFRPVFQGMMEWSWSRAASSEYWRDSKVCLCFYFVSLRFAWVLWYLVNLDKSSYLRAQASILWSSGLSVQHIAKLLEQSERRLKLAWANVPFSGSWLVYDDLTDVIKPNTIQPNTIKFNTVVVHQSWARFPRYKNYHTPCRSGYEMW